MIPNEKLAELGFEKRKDGLTSERNQSGQRLWVGKSGEWKYGHHRGGAAGWNFLPVVAPKCLAEAVELMTALQVPLGPMREKFTVDWLLSNGWELDPDETHYVRVLLHKTEPKEPADIDTVYLCMYAGPDETYFGLLCVQETYGSGKSEYFTEIRYGAMKTKADVLLLLKDFKVLGVQ